MMPSRVVMRQEVPSARADTIRRENLLPTHMKETQEDTADISRQRASSRENNGDSDTFVSYKWGRYEPVVEKTRQIADTARETY